MTSPGRLAGYLRARRELLRPEDVGLVVVGAERRKVAGLRREEVAVLAGISTDYYLRLEQGRDVNPSDQVLDALARALRLDPVATAYLHGLTRPTGRASAADHGDVVHESTLWLIDSWPLTAALVHNRYLDVLASNTLAQALNPNYRAGVNSVVAVLTDPSEKAFRADWEALAARSMAMLRNLADIDDGDGQLDAIVAEGTAGSSMFRELWERQDVVHVGVGVHVVRHPLVGELTLRFQRLPLAGTDGQSIFLYFAEPGTPSALGLQRLAEAR